MKKKTHIDWQNGPPPEGAKLCLVRYIDGWNGDKEPPKLVKFINGYWAIFEGGDIPWPEAMAWVMRYGQHAVIKWEE